ncbi:MAG TPA: site-2 protease family protein [Burkholderiales bacterium]|nr:site-2 protease family protein [Burkholderiales bacterium]
MIKALLLLLQAGKLGKVLLTSGTMLLSVLTYSLVYGWRYAVGLVGLIFCHEMGHYLAAKQRGLDVGAPTFIPFVGAWIQLKDMPHDVETEAYIGIAGPVIGSAAALVCYFAGLAQSSNLLLALAFAGFFINLFNLIPLSPLDGGRITAIVSPRLWLIGAPILVALFLWRPSPLLVLIALLAAPQLFRALSKKEPDEAEKRYYDVPMRTRVEYGAWYLGLAALLAVLAYEVHMKLQPGSS